MRIGEVDGQAGGDGERGVAGQFLAAVPGQGPAQRGGQGGDPRGQGGGVRGRGPVAGGQGQDEAEPR